MNTGTETNIHKEVSCRVTNSILKYLESRGYNCDSTIEGLPYPYTREYLTDTFNWVTYDIREKICQRAAELTGDDAIMYKVGLATPEITPLGGIESVIKKLTGPLMVYRFVPKYAGLFDRVFTFKTIITGKNTATIEMRTKEPDYQPSKDSCYYAQGILAAIPTLWNLPPAEVREKKCMYVPLLGAAQNGIQYRADACVYEVEWQPLPSWYQRLRDNILGKLFPVALDYKEFEQSLRYIDRKNVELVARNRQLAAVREIAMGVDKVRTIDEALAFTVEQSREIEGIRMVLVQKMDEARENVITPYYSKFRADTMKMVNAAKAIGINAEKVLGKTPTSNKLRFPLSKLKVAQEYNKNPRVMVLTTLAELLDGVWPKTLCDALQKIMGVKKFVIVPLMVEGESWGHILYFLTQDIPTDILEMIGGHCSLAIKNIINLNNLVERNTELTERNRQLAVVREIAASVNTVRTIDEALTLAVEQAREIEGIRFVLVQTLDESGEYITTPYYSKKRRDNALPALKALGIDPYKLLGKTPTSNKLRFPVSKIKIAQDYLKNPQITAIPSLADLLDGVMPRALCDGIQKILKIKRLVLVPLLLEKRLWGNILYFLTYDVPIDILEMIGTHCGLALNNILNTDNLVSRNTELTGRNKQLAIVREIALGVDKVTNIDEALGFAVEQAREIEGVRFVLVQKLDENKEYVTTPYYSKIRPQSQLMVNAIKALGFDPEKELGKDSTSNKLRFRFSKLKAAQDYVQNPRVMVFTSLAELLDGIWPRTLCKGIQKIMGVKKLVIVPIMVESESWGNLLFFLTQDVPLDILEMIGAHCALAVRNIGNIEALGDEAIRRRILIDESLDGIVILDDKAAVVEANKKFAEMLGYSPEEVRKLHTWDWDVKWKPETLLEMGRGVGSGPEGLHVETQHRRKDGTIFDVEISINGATLNGRKLIFCVCRDVTERNQMHEALRESEDRYRTIFESAKDILILINNKGKIVDVNDRISDVGGYERGDLIGKDIRTLSNIMTKKSLAVVAGNYLKRMAGLNVPFYDVEMVKKNGERRIIQINAVAVRKGGKIIGDLAILRDITEIKQTEENLKFQKDLIDRILATIPNAVLLLNKNLNVIIANQTFYKLFKLKKNKVEKKNVNQLINNPELDQAIKNILDSKEQKTSTEFRYYIGSTEKILITNIFPMENEYLLLVINDVTEEREKQERLYLTDRLVSVGEMAAGIAHELNNPLTSVIGLSSLLVKQEVPETTKEDLRSIYSEAQRCANIVKNLLTFARKHAPKKEPLQIASVVNDVLKLRAYEHKINNISVKTEFPPDLPVVLADYFEIQQVFINIILNAEAAMIDANGYGTLKISGKAVNNHVNISFSDTGPGITRENMRYLFNPFFTTKEVGKGTGLGLSICYGIIASHGGKIYARSEYGKGATFVVELPVFDISKEFYL
ncbi:MAG: PAS domain S-box protein [Dehalococcoidales bacterium]|nr:PAS domain S-box protein [Dehalococcoidales bacterium]